MSATADNPGSNANASDADASGQPTVAIVGASTNPVKYGNRSVRAHLAGGYRVFPVNPNEEEVEGLRCYPRLTDLPVSRLDRLSIYVPPAVGFTLLGDLQAANAAEIWFNPGSEDAELLRQARDRGLNVIQACSIIDAGRGL